MTRKRLSADESKKIILTHAKELFIEKGYDRATMDHLCTSTQMSKGNLYHHFKNKEVLFLQLLSQHAEETSQKWLDSLEHSASPSEQLLAIAGLLGRDCETPLLPAIAEYGKTLSSESESLATLKEITEITYRAIRQVLQQGIEKGEFIDEDIEDLCFGVMSTLSGATQLCLTMPKLSGDEYAALHTNAIKLLLKGISVKEN
ncbi:transcriptional regulator, TetR family [Thermoactinomyces sp. DSM 45891]|uniref:TetR/AcrR family transcriptional regulator n=1 Tax=Thermoactinomyces sp. DSM 45891 TaxID=1761907 RepID=UPI0009149667|nr:TetR/AcrR family transcriptional regulator [Thermoactinomyces sp. DSM 45891]SFX54391.1 transcriptional regulator, TetR family [Thermoactinomyces sp. DSM 45891]